jgi:hypothetical protein
VYSKKSGTSPKPHSRIGPHGPRSARGISEKRMQRTQANCASAAGPCGSLSRYINSSKWHHQRMVRFTMVNERWDNTNFSGSSKVPRTSYKPYLRFGRQAVAGRIGDRRGFGDASRFAPLVW